MPLTTIKRNLESHYGERKKDGRRGTCRQGWPETGVSRCEKWAGEGDVIGCIEIVKRKLLVD